MKTIYHQFELLEAELAKLKNNVKKELEEIRQCKHEVQALKKDIQDGLEQITRLSCGKYIRDDYRIILSAPEIIIGDVDQDGVLNNMPSQVIVRSNRVRLEGTADMGGEVTTRASRIHFIAEDPGKDGGESVVMPVSEIVSQAKSVALRTEDTKGVFTTLPCATMHGIELDSETGILLSATESNKIKKDRLSHVGENLKANVAVLEDRAKECKNQVDSYMKEIGVLMDFDNLTEDVITTRTSYQDIEELYDSFNSLSAALFSSMLGYSQVLSQLAEVNRQSACVEEMEKEVDKKKSTFKDKSTGNFIYLRSECIDALSVDGDGNIRENPEAGVSINAKHVSVGTFKADESLQEDSFINLSSRKVEISTINPKVERNDKGEISKGDYPAVGDVIIQSKNIQMETVDYEWKDKKLQEKALTKEGIIAMRTEKVDVSVTDTEGKATGQVEVNAKAVEVKSMDVDKEKRTDKSLAAGSTMLLLSEKMYVGAKDSKTRSKQMQVASDKTGVFADTTLELQQDKAVVQLSGGNAAVGGGNLDLYGKTTLQGDVTAKGKVAGGDIEMKNMKVSSSFKSPCTSEGVAVPGAPATGKLSAKLKEEELKAKEK